MATPIIPALGTIPQGIAPAPQPQNQADLQAKILNLKALQQQLGNGQLQQQSEQQKIQLQQMELDDRNGLHRAMIDSGGDPDKLRANILDPKYGVSPTGQFSTIKSLNDYKTSQLQLGEADRKNNMDSDAALADRYQKIQELPEGAQGDAVSALKSDANFLQSLTPRGQQEIANFQYAGPDSVKLMAHSHMTRAAIDDQAGKELDQQNKALALKAKTDWLAANTGKTEADYDIAQEQAKAKAKAEGEMQGQQAGADSGAPMTSAMADAKYRSIQAKIAQKQPLTPEEKAFSTAYEKQKTLVGTTNFNMQNGLQNGQVSPETIDALGKGQMRWSDIVSARTPMSVKSAILSEVKAKYPDFNSGDFDVEKKVKETATSGTVGQQLLAIGTARQHMQLFGELADALDNGNVQLLNKIGNTFGVQFGSDKATNLKIAAQAFGGEVGKAFDGAGVVASERESAQKAYEDYLSKGQFKGAIQTVDKLLAGKQKAAHEWFDKGTQAKPDFGDTAKTEPSFTVPTGAPAAPKEDNKVLKQDGKIVAKSQGGQWVAP